MNTKRNHRYCLFVAAALSLGAFLSTPARAADHGDAPTLAYDQAADIADVYFFVDPNDNTQAVMIATVRGFIVPGEAVNFAIFDPTVRYRFEIYNDHVNVARPPQPNPNDPKPMQAKAATALKKYVDRIKPAKTIDVTFSARIAGDGPAGKEILQIPQKQTATVQFTGFADIDKKALFTADVLNPNLNAPAAGDATKNQGAVQDLDTTGVKFFAGEVDDPFFFDIPGLARFIASIRNGAPNPNTLMRGRDTFAGYNVLSIALRVPVSKLTSDLGPVVGLNFLTQRHKSESATKVGTVKGAGPFTGIDREGNPAVNVVLVPFNDKNVYNASTPKDDANLKFASDIVTTLKALGTTGEPFDGFGVSNLGTLASVAVLQGDLLKLNTATANMGTGGGTTAGAGFPNGRRLQDDVVDTLLFFIANGLTGGDHVDANDVTFGDTFPFLAPSQQPRDPNADPVINADDNTRN